MGDKFAPSILEGAALTSHHGLLDKKITDVEKYTRNDAFSVMNNLVWNKSEPPGSWVLFCSPRS